MPIIQVKKLKKKYGEFEAVRGIDFEVDEGEVFGLLGPNGAGKTTTVEILEGLIKSTSGEAFINDLDVSKDTKSVKKIIGVQLQFVNFFEKLSLFEIVELFSTLYSYSADPGKILERVGLLNKKDSIYSLIKFRNKYFIKKFNKKLIGDSKIIETSKDEIIMNYDNNHFYVSTLT